MASGQVKNIYTNPGVRFWYGAPPPRGAEKGAEPGAPGAGRSICARGAHGTVRLRGPVRPCARRPRLRAAQCPG